MQTIQLGQSIESLVCEFLEERKLDLVCRNYRCRLGEIDLVFLNPDTSCLVFVEVRFRSSEHHGQATETVDRKKLRKLRRAVLHYLQKHANATQQARIDVIGVRNAPALTESAPHCLTGIQPYQYRGYELVWIQNALEE